MSIDNIVAQGVARAVGELYGIAVDPASIVATGLWRTSPLSTVST